MHDVDYEPWKWIWPQVGPTPISQGLDSEMFDRTDYPYTETFVREAIQNSLDARLDQDRPVIVKFKFHEEIISCRQRAILDQVIEFRKRAGLDVPDEWRSNEIKWIVVEDFNARGLGGDLKKRTSDYWSYWLNFGLSNKDGSGRGGRGIGRVTFLIASRLQSVIGYTRRHADSQHAVCGMAVLRAMEDGDHFLSTHAYLAAKESGSVYDLYSSNEFHAQVREAFHFNGYDEPATSGLGFAIPYPHSGLSPKKILAAAIENFAPAIIRGILELNVNEQRLDAKSIRTLAKEISGDLNDEAIAEDPERYLGLIQLGITIPQPHTIHLNNALKGEIENRRESKEVKKIQKHLSVGGDPVVIDLVFPLERCGVNTNVTVRAVVGPVPHGSRPMDRLFREGMSLPDVRSRNPDQLDLILLVERGELATYLNFCEGKAHLDLLESREIRQKLTERGFSHGIRVKRFVKNLPADLRLLLTPEISEPDAYVFDEFFSVHRGKNGTGGGNGSPKPPNPPPPPKPPSFWVDTLTDGLRIRANPDFEGWPINVTLTLAYADGTRQPSWSKHDFQLEQLHLDQEDCQIEMNENRIRAFGCGPRCRIEITGFDINRELDTLVRPWRNAQEN